MTREKALELMRHPSRWPLRAVLALTHRTRRDDWDTAELGFLAIGKGPVVWLANVLDLRPGPLGPQLADMKSEQYSTFEALLEDWTVD